MGHLKLDRWIIVDLEYGNRTCPFHCKKIIPYIKDIWMRFSIFPSVYVDKSLCNNTENWISRVRHIETANEGKEASGADQLPDTRVLIVLMSYFTHEKSENLCLYFMNAQKESWKSNNMPILDNYFLYFGVILFSISNLMLAQHSTGSSSIQKCLWQWW